MEISVTYPKHDGAQLFMVSTEPTHMFHASLQPLVRRWHTPDHLQVLVTLLFNNVTTNIFNHYLRLYLQAIEEVWSILLQTCVTWHSCRFGNTKITEAPNFSGLTVTSFMVSYRNNPCSFSYSSSQQENTSKHWVMTRSKSSKGMCIKRRVPSTFKKCLSNSEKGLEHQSRSMLYSS